jgi:hypothetical protein
MSALDDRVDREIVGQKDGNAHLELPRVAVLLDEVPTDVGCQQGSRGEGRRNSDQHRVVGLLSVVVSLRLVTVTKTLEGDIIRELLLTEGVVLLDVWGRKGGSAQPRVQRRRK